MAFEPDDRRPLLVSGLLAGQVDAAVQARAADPLNGQRVLRRLRRARAWRRCCHAASWFIPYAPPFSWCWPSSTPPDYAAQRQRGEGEPRDRGRALIGQRA
jgi:hypothetical protein